MMETTGVIRADMGASINALSRRGDHQAQFVEGRPERRAANLIQPQLRGEICDGSLAEWENTVVRARVDPSPIETTAIRLTATPSTRRVSAIEFKLEQRED